MKIDINITATAQDLDRFQDRKQLQHFYRDRGMDGLELMLCGSSTVPEKIPEEDVVGIHLRYYPGWIDFWRGDEEALCREYGDLETARKIYGRTREEFLAPWRQELEIAREAGAQYVVFHVSECVLEECTTYRFRHTDREVCQAACEIINALLEGKNYDFYFLAENLWWSGMNLMDPQVTKEMMEGIRYRKKGIMLDTGHLLHTNLDIMTQEEGVRYIGEVLDRMGTLTDYIRGIHLNQSLSGDYVKKSIKNPISLTGSWQDRLMAIYPHIFNIDYHEPFTAPGIAALIRRIAPEFVTIELITRDLRDHGEKLDRQLAALREQGGIR